MQYDNDGRFKIENYPSQKPFSSFLPGIAGVLGIPMWVFYTNRGQGIAGFGVQSKDAPIMEFQPANKAYQLTATHGFRTFIKTKNDYYEPFSPFRFPHNPHRDMFISINELEIQETEPTFGLQTSVIYYTLVNEPFAGLVRLLTIKNTSANPIEGELLDGMPALVPYGVDNWNLKMMARTAEAWLQVFNLAHQVPFFRTRASIVDKSEIEGVEAGQFYLAFHEHRGESTIISPIVDPGIVFGSNTARTYPDQFIAHNLDVLQAQPQVTVGKTPCAFCGATFDLAPGASFSLHTVVGHVNNVETLNRVAPRLATATYLREQHHQAHQLINALTDTVRIKTANTTFDAYARQTFLDNVMRGGWPVIPGEDIVYHVYSRKHGDMERDYNNFFLAAEPYSQGNGNFRDVNQNRREDVWFKPTVGDFNIRTFINLVQADGYNPLVLEGSRFTVRPGGRNSLRYLLAEADQIDNFSLEGFTLGELLTYIDVNDVKLTVTRAKFIEVVCQHVEQSVETSFHEGYWVDHWTYNLDLIENYLGVYPDRESALLFERRDFTFYDSEAIVRPRHEKYVLSDGNPRQFNAVMIDAEKSELIATRQHHPNMVRTAHGHGDIYRTSLMSKLLCLAVIKMATLDPDGMGIEMEADKPGWYDAINGLPGLFGSSMPETFELLRLVRFMTTAISKQPEGTVAIPVEVASLLDVLCRDADYWEVTAAREHYRAQVRLGFDGQERPLSHQEIVTCLASFTAKLNDGIARALKLNAGLPPTYFRYHPTDYEQLDTTDENGRPNIRVNHFAVEVLPLFLEGPVRFLKVADVEDAKAVYAGVRNSPLFDAKLKMYKLNAALDDQPLDIGRARAFTSGWLENGSIWMHMAYKYLLALLKAGLHEEFFESFATSLIAFQDPKVYGRSVLENSSFIASSDHPDASIHGQGFVARLSGATVEFLSILHHMMIGPKPFVVHNGAVHLRFEPTLPSALFDENGQVQCTFLGKCTVTYHNPAKTPSLEGKPRQIVLHSAQGTIEIQGEVIKEPYSLQVRNGEISAIDVFY